MILSTDIETAVTEAVDQSLRETFEMMVGQSLTIKEKSCPVKRQSLDVILEQAISVVMGWSGDLQGSLCLTLSDLGARRWTNGLIDHDSGEVDQTVVDAVGELGNMVVGGTKRRLTDFQLTMSLPSVIRAGSASMVFPTNTTPLKMTYDSENEPLTVMIGLSK